MMDSGDDDEDGNCRVELIIGGREAWATVCLVFFFKKGVAVIIFQVFVFFFSFFFL